MFDIWKGSRCWSGNKSFLCLKGIDQTFVDYYWILQSNFSKKWVKVTESKQTWKWILTLEFINIRKFSFFWWAIGNIKHIIQELNTLIRTRLGEMKRTDISMKTYSLMTKIWFSLTKRHRSAECLPDQNPLGFHWGPLCILSHFCLMHSDGRSLWS